MYFVSFAFFCTEHVVVYTFYISNNNYQVNPKNTAKGKRGDHRQTTLSKERFFTTPAHTHTY